ncbi:transmembrane protein [mine drainage metagenome]|uniref:Transmembrane protein n=1 Tax=mine drainage metagenome TaxID=410659 RepID=T1BI54_9ZZZZ
MNANQFTALVRRELWEHRWFIRCWLILPSLLVFSGLLGLAMVALFSRTFGIQVEDSVTHPSGAILFLVLGTIFGLMLLFCIAGYFSHTLHDERMDRSYVFWKSIPVSDTATVGSKVLTGLIVMPILIWLSLIVTALILLFFLSLATSLLGHNFWGSFWAPGPLISIMLYLAVLLLTLPLWFFPLLAWILLCSAWGNPRRRKSPLLRALVIPGALLILEPVLLGTHVLATWFASLFAPIGGLILTYTNNSSYWGHATTIQSRWLDWAHLFIQPEFWWGGLIGLLFTALAVYFRHRTESHR